MKTVYTDHSYQALVSTTRVIQAQSEGLKLRLRILRAVAEDPAQVEGLREMAIELEDMLRYLTFQQKNIEECFKDLKESRVAFIMQPN